MKDQVKKWVRSSKFRFVLLQELRHELHLMGLRAKNQADPRARRSIRALSQLRDVKLHFGCGSRILDGWVNIDAYPAPGVDFLMDLRSPLPFGDESVQCIFTEHVLEHIERPDVARVARDYYRVLKWGGVARIIVPDLQFYCEKYVSNDVDEITAPLPGAKTAAEAINSVFNDHFHRYIYDFPTLDSILRQAGFTDVKQTAYGESAFPGLAMDSPGRSRRLGSLCVEARKTGD